MRPGRLVAALMATNRTTWTFRIIRWPTATLSDVGSYPFPRGDDPAGSRACASGRCKLRNETPFAVVSGISGVVYEICWYLRGLQRWFMDMVEQPEFCEACSTRPLASGWTVPRVPRRSRRLWMWS